jgi:hypothetical protein
MLSRRFSMYCRRATYAADIHINTNPMTITEIWIADQPSTAANSRTTSPPPASPNR